MLKQWVRCGSASVVDPRLCRLNFGHTYVCWMQHAVVIEVNYGLRRCHVDRLLTYIETTEKRNRIIKVIEVLALTGSALLTVTLLAAVYLRDYA